MKRGYLVAIFVIVLFGIISLVLADVDTPMLSDDFEGDLSLWDGNGVSTFTLSEVRYVSATHSVEGASTSTLISDSIDMSDATAINVTFKYWVVAIDANDNVNLDYWDGTQYVTIDEIGDDAEDTWLTFSQVTTNSAYFGPTFHIRIDGSSIDANEYLYLDDVIIIKSALPPDLEYPLFSSSSQIPANNTEYTEGATHEFNITITSTNTTAGIEFDGTNYSLSNDGGDIYNWTRMGLSAGTHTYYYWAYGNGTSHWFNNSIDYDYTVAKNSSLVLGISGTSPLEYPNITDVAGSGCPSQLTCSLDKSNAIYGVDASPVAFNYSTAGNANYSAASATIDITINQNTSYVLSISKTASIEYPTETDFAGSGCPAELSCSLNLTNGVFGVGTISANYSTAGNANYSANSVVDSITITQNSSLVLGLTASTPITYPTETDFAGSDCPAELSCSLNISNGVYGVGTISANYSTAGNANYSAASATFTVTINQNTSAGVYTYLNNSRDNITIYNNTAIWLNVTMLNVSGTISLYNNGTSINSGVDSVSNLTAFNDTGLYNITGIYIGDENYSAASETWWVEVIPEAADSEYPQFSSLTENPANSSDYSSGIVYKFNATITSTNGTAGIEFDGTNYTVSNSSDVFNASVSDLAAGTYNYYWWAYGNGSLGNYNTTSIQSYTINKATAETSLTFDLPSPQNYETAITPTCSVVTGTGTAVLTLNGTVITSGSPITLGAGTWTFNCSLAATQNYTSAENVSEYTINQISQSITPLLNGINDNLVVTYPQQINASYTGTNQTPVSIEINGTSVAAGTNYTWGAGGWTVNFSVPSNQNYSSYEIHLNLTINQATGSVSLLLNDSASDQLGIYGTQTNASASTSEGTVTLYRNGTDVTAENNVFVTLGAGDWNYTAISSGNQNYSGASIERWVNISVAASEINLTLNGTQGNTSILQTDTILLNATLITGDPGGILTLYNNGTSINAKAIEASNQTTFNTIGLFNITAIYSATQNYSSSSKTYYVNVTPIPDLTAPSINIVYPDNTTYSTNVSVINYTFTEINPDTCWYSKDSGANNYSIQTMGQNFTSVISSEGSNTWTVYCNDTSGNENSTSVTFFKDSISPIISIVYPTNNTNTTNTGLNVNYTFTETNPETCWYYNGTGNTTISCGTNITTITWLEGLTNVIVYINDTLGNQNSTSVSFRIDTTPPYFNPTPSNQDISAKVSLSYDINANDDGAGLDSFAINDTFSGLFNMDSSTGVLTNTSSLLSNLGLYYLNITINDTLNNLNSTVILINISLIDNVKPYFVGQVNNQTIAYLDALNYNINASDETELDSFVVNDTKFKINNSGSLENNTSLGVGLYWINITINDTSNNLNSSVIYVNVTPLTPQGSISGTASIDYGTAGDIEGSETNIGDDDVVYALYRNGVSVSNPDTATLSAGTYNYVYNATAGTNYTANASIGTFTLTVNQLAGNITGTINHTSSNFTAFNGTANQNIYLNATNTTGVGNCLIYVNGTLYNNATCPVFNVTNLSIGIYNITFEFEGNENYTSDSEVWWVNVSTPPDLEYPQFSNYWDNNGTFTNSGTGLFNVTITSTNQTAFLEINGTNYSASNTGDVYNVSVLLSTGTYSYQWHSWGNGTDSNFNSSAARSFSVGEFNLTLLKPENKTYLNNDSILLDYSATNSQSVWYNIDNSANTTINSSTRFSTSEGGHTLHLYANNSLGESLSREINFSVNSTKFSINKSQFNEGQSTNLSEYSYEELGNLSNFTLHIVEYGKLQFNQPINLTDDENATDDTINLNENINISFNRIEINSTALPNFNKSATLTLNNLTFTAPRILKDGDLCPSAICTEQSYSGGELIFNVTGFSVYSSEETPVTSTPSTSSSGGGGSVYSKQCTTNWTCGSWSFCSKDFTQTRTCNKINESCVAESKPEETRICPDILFDIKVDLVNANVLPWNNLKILINLKEINQSDLIDIEVGYEILNEAEEVIWTERETISIEDNYNYIKTINDLELPIGTYFLRVTIDYGKNQTASSLHTFRIISVKTSLIISAAAIFLILILIISYNWYKTRKEEEAIKGYLRRIYEKLRQKKETPAEIEKQIPKQILKERTPKRKKKILNILEDFIEALGNFTNYPQKNIKRKTKKQKNKSPISAMEILKKKDQEESYYSPEIQETSKEIIEPKKEIIIKPQKQNNDSFKDSDDLIKEAFEKDKNSQSKNS